MGMRESIQMHTAANWSQVSSQSLSHSQPLLAGSPAVKHRPWHGSSVSGGGCTFKLHDNVGNTAIHLPWLGMAEIPPIKKVFFLGGIPIVFWTNPCPRIYHLHDQICGPLCQQKKAHARWCPIVSEVGFQEGWPPYNIIYNTYIYIYV